LRGPEGDPEGDPKGGPEEGPEWGPEEGVQVLSAPFRACANETLINLTVTSGSVVCWLGGKCGAGVAGYRVPGCGKRGVWKTWGVENAG